LGWSNAGYITPAGAGFSGSKIFNNTGARVAGSGCSTEIYTGIFPDPLDGIMIKA